MSIAQDLDYCRSIIRLKMRLSPILFFSFQSSEKVICISKKVRIRLSIYAKENKTFGILIRSKSMNIERIGI